IRKRSSRKDIEGQSGEHQSRADQPKSAGITNAAVYHIAAGRTENKRQDGKQWHAERAFDVPVIDSQDKQGQARHGKEYPENRSGAAQKRIKAALSFPTHRLQAKETQAFVQILLAPRSTDGSNHRQTNNHLNEQRPNGRAQSGVPLSKLGKQAVIG